MIQYHSMIPYRFYHTVHVPGTVPGKESITSTDVISYCDVLDVY
jgi:hypothetical protein